MRPFFAILITAALLLIETLTGGTRLILLLPSLALLGVAALTSPFVRGGVDVAPRPICLAATALFFGYALVRAYQSPVDYLWWADFITILGGLAVYSVTVFGISGSRERRIVVAGLLLFVLAEVFLGLRQYATGERWLPFGLDRPLFEQKRASGTFISPNHFAGMLELIGPLALSFAMWSTWRGWFRTLAGYAGVLCYVGIAISGSRGGWISAGVSLAVFSILTLTVMRATRPKTFPLAFAGFLVLTTLVIGGGVHFMLKNPVLENRMNSINRQFEGEFDIRIYNWQAALDQFRLAPIFGTGAGTQLYYSRLFRRPEIQSDPIHVHNDYLELLAEYGVIGALAASLFLAAHFLAGWRACRWLVRKELHDIHEAVRVSHDGLALQIGALSGLSAIAAHSALDFNLHIPGNALLVAFLCGLLASPGAPPLPPRALARLSHLRWISLCLGITLLAGVAMKSAGAFWGEKARVALREQRFEQATSFGEKAIAAETRNPELYFILAESYRGSAARATTRPESKKRLAIAVDFYRETLSRFPQDENAWVRMAQALAELEDYKAADAAFQTAIRLDPKQYKIRVQYARYLRQIGREAQADETLQWK